jgi:hypothetical protein
MDTLPTPQPITVMSVTALVPPAPESPTTTVRLVSPDITYTATNASPPAQPEPSLTPKPAPVIIVTTLAASVLEPMMTIVLSAQKEPSNT